MAILEICEGMKRLRALILALFQSRACGAGVSSESGFSGFCQLVFDWQALIRIRIGGISVYGEKRGLDESEILKIPLILKILILTNTRGRTPCFDFH